MNKTLEKAVDAIEEAIKPIIKKGEAMTAAELESLTKSICLIEKIKNIQQLDNEKVGSYENGYSENYRNYNEPYSYERGRSSITGRFVSRDNGSYNESDNSTGYYDGRNYRDYGNSTRRYNDSNNYSGHSKHDRMIAALEEMLDNAQTEHERNFVREWLNRVS